MNSDNSMILKSICYVQDILSIEELKKLNSILNLLSHYNVDNDTIISSILFQIYNKDNDKFIENEFGSNIKYILDKAYNIKSNENYIYMLDYNNIDINALKLILVERMNDINLNKDLSQDTLDVLCPIADKLGLSNIKSDLEDIAFYNIDPNDYIKIQSKLKFQKSELKNYIKDMIKDITIILKKYNIDFEINSRVKNIYSIYNKLQTGRDWNDIYDILAIRVVVDDIDTCYKIINILNSNYESVPSRYRDYITYPKNGIYQALHTTILGNDNNYYEVQVKTKEMNKSAEHTHYEYKKNKITK